MVQTSIAGSTANGIETPRLVMTDGLSMDFASGKKFITILKGFCCDNVKPLQHACIVGMSGKWGCSVTITRVTYCTLETVPTYAMLRDGFHSPREMILTIRKTHPDISPETPITIVEWKDISDYWRTV
jgi:hypothetical protein